MMYIIEKKKSAWGDEAYFIFIGTNDGEQPKQLSEDYYSLSEAIQNFDFRFMPKQRKTSILALVAEVPEIEKAYFYQENESYKLANGKEFSVTKGKYVAMNEEIKIFDDLNELLNYIK